MRRGDFERAWEISDGALDARRGISCWHMPRHEQYLWDGSPLDGRQVLVRCYHGLGDTIQFARYLPLVRERSARLAVWVQPPLIPLLRSVDRAMILRPLHDGEPDVAYDADLEIMELPHVFRSTLATLPAHVPYVDVPPAALPDTGSLKVGLVWRAGEWAEHRSIPFVSLEPLTNRRVTWHVLQGQPGLSERPADSVSASVNTTSTSSRVRYDRSTS
jgi:hypothetical protein